MRSKNTYFRTSSKQPSTGSTMILYLHGRPRQVILHCLDRKSSSHKFQEDDIVNVSGKAGEFTVQGKKRVHTVDFGTSSGMPSCTCPDWTKNQLPCKHFFAVFKHKKEWSWNDLSQEYLCKPHISADIKALNTHFSQRVPIGPTCYLQTTIFPLSH